MKPLFSIFLSALLSCGFFWRPAPNTVLPSTARAPKPVSGTGQLILFTQAADTHFVRNTLPRLRTWANRSGLDLIERDATAGVPREVTATPALYFRNSAGYALFGGRYVDFTAIENFVRVNRVRPKAPAPDVRTEVLLRQRGRQRIIVPLKVTRRQGDYQGTEPDWAVAVHRAIAALPGFSVARETRLWPTDRRFYLDVHPYVDASGTAFLSAAVFSQFDCIHPVWDNFSEPIGGRVAAPEEPLYRLAAQLALVIEKQLADFPAGDALVPLRTTAVSWDWNRLPLAPKAPERGAAGPVNMLASDRYADPQPVQAEVPMLQFNFPAPLDRYAGEVRELEGALRLDTVGYRLAGEFIARVKTLTMGMAELDAKVLKSYLRAKKYPRARFRFTEVQIPPGYDGQQPLELLISGTFTLLGKEETVLVKTRLEPTVTESGRPAVGVSAAFQLDIADPFGLTGPDGPPAIRNRLDFQLDFILQS